MAQLEEHTVASTQHIGELDANDDIEDDKNRPRADSDLLEADHALVKTGSPSKVEPKYLGDDGTLETSVEELESAVGKEVTTDYGKATVEKVEEIAGEMFLVIKYEDGSEENIKYQELGGIMASPKKSSSTKKSTSTKKVKEPKAASPKAKAASPKTSPPPKKKIAKPAAKSPAKKPAAKATKAVKKPAKKAPSPAKPAKKVAAAKVIAKKTTTTKKTK